MLSEYFAEDLANFNENNFKSISTMLRRELRDILRARGVYVPKGRDILIADALFRVLQNELPWPDDDDDAPDGIEVVKQPEAAPSTSHHHGTNISDASKAIANISKSYNRDEDRYNGKENDNFEHKVWIFKERCDQNAIDEVERSKAFSIMLYGHALQFYFDELQGKRLTVDQLCDGMRKRFLTEEHTRAILHEWESIKLQSIMSRNGEKKPIECLEILVALLQDIHSGLSKEYCNEVILRSKLLNAVKDVDVCKLAYFKPATDLSGIIADLHSSLGVAPASTQPAPQAFFIDCKFKGTRRGTRPKTCKKEACWSTNHTQAERIAALKKNKVFCAFWTSVDDEEDDDEGPEFSFADELEDIAAHVIEGHNEEKLSDIPGSDAHLCFMSSNDEGPKSFMLSTSESSMYHCLSSLVMEPDRYTTNLFYVEMIDTGCAHASSSSIEQ